MPKPLKFGEILGAHPTSTNPLGARFASEDDISLKGVPYRSLTETDTDVDLFVQAMRAYLKTHHSRPEDSARDLRRREAYIRQGFTYPTSRFPKNPTTRKGNWAEVLLCEYVAASCGADVPIYRLRYNPNVEQSMKGDDVLAFDLEADPVRIIVGEAKFRSTSSKQAVANIIKALEKSFHGGLPASLQFVADRLFMEGNEDLGRRVEECADLFVRDKLEIDHIGLLASNHLASKHVKKNANSSLRRLAVIAIALGDGGVLVEASFDGLEEAP